MVTNVLVRAVSKSTIGISQEYFRPAVILPWDALFNPLPKHFNAIRFRSTMWCMDRKHNASKEICLQLDNEKARISGNDSKVFFTKPALWMRRPILLECEWLLFGKTNEYAKLAFVIGWRMPEKIV